MEEKNSPLFIAFQQGYARRNSCHASRDWDEFKKEYSYLFALPLGLTPLPEPILTDKDMKDWEAEQTAIEMPKQPGVVWPLFVIDKATGACHEVNKLVYHPENDPEPHVWCDTWYGHHVIGKDCEWAKKSTTGAVWVKASDRLPGWVFPVKWRLGNGPETQRKIALSEMTDNGMKEILKWEWFDESGTAEAISQHAHEKEVMMQAFDKVRQIFEGRQWIMGGRGSYPYNDDRYKEEVRYMYDEFDAIQKDTWENIESKSFEYRKAIVAEYVKGTAAGREEDAVEFAEWIRSNHYDVYGNMWRRTGSNMEVSSARLYKLSKQQQEKP